MISGIKRWMAGISAAVFRLVKGVLPDRLAFRFNV